MKQWRVVHGIEHTQHSWEGRDKGDVGPRAGGCAGGALAAHGSQRSGVCRDDQFLAKGSRVFKRPRVATGKAGQSQS